LKEIRRVEESFLPEDKADLPVLVTRYLLAGPGMRRGRFGKIHLTDTRHLLWSPGAPLSPAGTGRQLRARAKDEPGDICFPFVDKHIAFGVSEWRYVSRRWKRERGRGMRKKDLFPGTGTWLSYQDWRETSRSRSPQKFDGSTQLRLKFLS